MQLSGWGTVGPEAIRPGFGAFPRITSYRGCPRRGPFVTSRLMPHPSTLRRHNFTPVMGVPEMRIRPRISITSFAAGAVCAILLAPPATILALQLQASDPNPGVVDGTVPSLTVQPAEFVLGASVDQAGLIGDDDCASYPWNQNIPLRLRWSVSDATSGLSRVEVWGAAPRAGNPGPAKIIDATNATSYEYSGTNYDGDCGGGGSSEGYWWVIAHDNRGNFASSSTRNAWATAWDETGNNAVASDADLAVRRTGTWSTSNCTCFNNGHTIYSTRAGASITYTVTTSSPGQVVAVLAEKAANRGSMTISVDAGTPTAIDTYAPTATHRVIVWQRAISTPGTHTIRISNAGTSGRPRIDVDGILRAPGGWGLPPQLEDYVQE